MKRHVLFALPALVLLVFVLAACKKTDPAPSITALRDAYLATTETESTLSSSLVLPDTLTLLGEEVTLAYSSSNESVLSSSGTYTAPDADTDVTLTVTLSRGSDVVSITRLFHAHAPARTAESALAEAITSLAIPAIVKTDLSFPSTVTIDATEASLVYNVYPAGILSTTGLLTPPTAETSLTLTVGILWNGTDAYQDITLTVPLLTTDELFAWAENRLVIPTETTRSLSLPKSLGRVSVSWSSSDETVLTSAGTCLPRATDDLVTLTAILSVNGKMKVIDYPITCLRSSDEDLLALAMAKVSLPSKTDVDLVLPTTFLHDATGVFSSSDEAILSSTGVLASSTSAHAVSLTLTLTLGSATLKKTFAITAEARTRLSSTTNYQIYRANALSEAATLTNVTLQGAKLMLSDGEVTGTVTSPEYSPSVTFTQAVASWSATSSTSASVKLEIRVKSTSGVWSQYFSYGFFGWGLSNSCPTGQSDAIASLDEDTVVATSSLSAYQFRLTLRRSNASSLSPALSLVAIDLRKPTTQTPDVSQLPSSLDYTVPLVNQNMVPSIGGSICSPTTSTMLLMYKGQDFSSYDEYPNRYVAQKVYDAANGIYGNWVYNTVGMSSFGYDAYFLSLSSFAELQSLLATVGPCGASVRGNTGLYTTSGHLIVVRGFVVRSGVTYVRVNDPNINSRFGTDAQGNDLFVYYEYSLSTFLAMWTGGVYVME